MPKFYIEVWASVGACSDKEVIAVDQKEPPTDAEMHETYRDYIGNIMDSGYALVSEVEYKAYQGGQ